MKLIIDIDEKWKAKCSMLSSIEELNYLYDIVQNGTPIPDNATNGDVLKTFIPMEDCYCDESAIHFYHYIEWNFPKWWNAPYQKGCKDEVN